MAQLGLADEGRTWLRGLWDDYATLATDDRETLALAMADMTEGLGAEWLPRLEAAVLALPRDGALAVAAGQALMARQLWGKARSLLEQAARDETVPAPARRKAWLQLAELAERDEEDARAAQCLRAAALLT